MANTVNDPIDPPPLPGPLDPSTQNNWGEQVNAAVTQAYQRLEVLRAYLAGLTTPDVAGEVATFLAANPVTKAAVGLANVDNTTDELKPLSKPARDALAGIKQVTSAVPYEVTRTLSTSQWREGSSAVLADFAAARAAGRAVWWNAPLEAGPVWGVAVDQAHAGDKHFEIPAPPYNPASIAGLAYHWNPDTLVAADGTSVASLAATVGGLPLAQTGSARMPTLKTVSGRRLVHFDAGSLSSDADDLNVTLPADVDGDGTPDGQPVTLFMVHDGQGVASQQLIQSGVELSWSTTNNALNAFAGTSFGKTGLVLPQGLGVTIVVVNGAASKLYRNGGAPATGNAGAGIPFGGTFRVGRHSTSGRPGTFDMGDIGIYRGALSLSAINELGAGLAAKYPTATAWTAATA